MTSRTLGGLPTDLDVAPGPTLVGKISTPVEKAGTRSATGVTYTITPTATLVGAATMQVTATRYA